MSVFIEKSNINGEIYAPPSKSFAHRLIIMSFLSNQETVVKNVGNSTDVRATVEALKSLGGNIEYDGDSVRISGYTLKSDAKINACDSGSTLRFLLSVVSALGVKTTFCGTKKLLSRPNDALISCLNERGANISGLTVLGKISCGEYVLDGSLSSQYLSGLLMGLSCLKGESTVKIIGNKVSEDYVKITLKVLEIFGVKTEVKDNVYTVYGGNIKSPKTVCCEGDYSGSAFILSLGAIGGVVRVKGLNPDSVQGDREILDIISSFGGRVSVEKDTITVSKSELKGIEVDCENIPDLAQIISVLGAYSKGKTVLKNISRLLYKETDRIDSIIKTLSVSGIKCEKKDNDIIIYGGSPKNGVFDSFCDHRTTMSASVLSAFANGKSEILGESSVNKSYPNFFSDLKNLGVKLYVEI